MTAETALDRAEPAEPERHQSRQKIPGEGDRMESPHQERRREKPEAAGDNDADAPEVADDQVKSGVEGAEKEAEKSEPGCEPGTASAFRIGEAGAEKEAIHQ